MQRKPLHIGLLWHSCFNENLGVGALTVANANLIGAAVEKAGMQPVFHCLGVRGTFDYSHEVGYQCDFTNVGYKALANPFSDLHRAIRRCDIVFDIGGGDSFSDIYSARRFQLIIASKFAVRLHGVPLVLSPQTIGPFHTRTARLESALALKPAKHVFARDEPSFRVLAELGLKDRASITTDVAFALPFEASLQKGERDLADGPIKVGLNVSALLYRRDIAKGDRISLSADYPALIDAMIDRILRAPRIELHLVPHVLAEAAPHEDDYALAEALAERFPQAILPPRFSGPSEAKSYIAALDLFAGSRMHATIAALSSNTAVLPLGYSRKFSGLFGSLGYDWNSDLTTEANETVLSRLDGALSDLPSLRNEAMVANLEAHRRLKSYTGYLDKVFTELAAERV
ncbi:polysaccharide pyruvyl transferase family protein [Erythrobacter sp. F6033]|uniref:polysaccharide pyruvyl transferase family protein n=1 Tax=Erythrobacter sp. F6033 TaxID=2926401 RepID=UPI001FF5017F|nr:polysaccharide pyruvyl transferase family protein [Erythrobacter sp. F6033]MCK0127188.1 polysaccharide pyruvyl transferase family protein [Erythrobacter sp. F6033]